MIAGQLTDISFQPLWKDCYKKRNLLPAEDDSVLFLNAFFKDWPRIWSNMGANNKAVVMSFSSSGPKSPPIFIHLKGKTGLGLFGFPRRFFAGEFVASRCVLPTLPLGLPPWFAGVVFSLGHVEIISDDNDDNNLTQHKTFFGRVIS